MQHPDVTARSRHRQSGAHQTAAYRGKGLPARKRGRQEEEERTEALKDGRMFWERVTVVSVFFCGFVIIVFLGMCEHLLEVAFTGGEFSFFF